MKPGVHTVSLRRFATPQGKVMSAGGPEDVVGLRADHPAVINGTSIFPKSVTHPDEDEALLVGGENNMKLGGRVRVGPKAGFPIYHLTLEERATCPESCGNWRTCYGNAMPYARRNDAVSEPMRFFIALSHELGVLNRRHPGGFLVRLHTLGDFFAVRYVELWGAFLKQFPALHVFGYTACSPTASDKGERAIGRAVLDLTNENWERFAIRFSRSYVAVGSAVVLDAISDDPMVLMCPAQTGKTECCATCGVCWAPAARGKAIGFLRHGMKKGRRGAPVQAPGAAAEVAP